MVKQIFGFGKLIQEAGLGKIVKYIPQFACKTGRSGVVIFENGTSGVYNTLREGGKYLEQEIEVAGKRIKYNTQYGKELFSQSVWNGVKETLFPQTRSIGTVRESISEGAKHTFVANYTRIPLIPKTTKQGAKFKVSLPVVQELHTTKLVNGKALFPEDKLVSPSGELQPIFQRPMKMADRINFKEAYGTTMFQG